MNTSQLFARRVRGTLRPLVVVVAFLLSYSVAQTCDVPVFRYALERWMPTVYQVIVLHDAPLTPAQEELVKKMEARSIRADYAANYDVRVVELDPSEIENTATESSADEQENASNDEGSAEDTASEEGANADTPDDAAPETRKSPFVAVWEGAGKPELPTAVVVYPMFPPPECVFDHFPLNAEGVDRMIDSPVRQRLAELIMDDATGVWVLLKTGDEEKNAAAQEALREGTKEFIRVFDEMAGPAPADADAPPVEAPPEDLYPPGYEPDPRPVVPNYPVVVLDPDNPEEETLVSLLLQTEPDLKDYTDQPMAFPVFGRGRSLYALVGEGINQENVMDACNFLIGPCSCTVKDANPGIDLLMTYNWEEALMEQRMALMEDGEDASDASEESGETTLLGLSSLAEMATVQSTGDESEPAETATAPNENGEATAPSDDAATATSETPTTEPSQPPTTDEQGEGPSVNPATTSHDGSTTTTDADAHGAPTAPASPDSVWTVLTRTGLVFLVVFALALAVALVRKRQPE